uniref:Putative secreted protein n=1 Tax=Anopheles triannulatus TaxID=58253 RepID=A0A2M4B4Z7_9DIPT
MGTAAAWDAMANWMALAVAVPIWRRWRRSSSGSHRAVNASTLPHTTRPRRAARRGTTAPTSTRPAVPPSMSTSTANRSIGVPVRWIRLLGLVNVQVRRSHPKRPVRPLAVAASWVRGAP